MNSLRQYVSIHSLSQSIAVLIIALGLTAGLPIAAGAQGSSTNASQEEQLALLPGGADTSVHYVGVADATGIYVAVLDLGAGIVNMYLCDGAGVSVWLQGTAQNGAFQVTAQDGSTGTGTIAGGTAAGSVTLAGGTMLSFSASQAGLPAGFYERAAVENGVGVWARTIVLPDGTARGANEAGTTCAQRRSHWAELVASSNTAATASARDTAAHLANTVLHNAIAAGCHFSTT